MTGEPRQGRRPFEDGYPQPLREREAPLLARRREAAAVAQPVEEDAHGTEGLGVALSGGGIRSATFALGFFQGLARFDLVRRVDVLSTVSGGGYFGSFLGRLFCRKPAGPAAHADVRETLLGTRDPWVLGNLRENGRYLAPGGGADAFLGLSIVLRNLVSLLVVLLATLFAAQLVVSCWLDDHVYGFGHGPEGYGPGRQLVGWIGGRGLLDFYAAPWCSTWAVVPLALFLFAVVPLGWAYWLPERTRRGVWVWTWFFPVAMLGSGLAMLATGGTSVTVPGRLLTIVGGATLAWCGAALVHARRTGPSRDPDGRLRVRIARRTLTTLLSLFLLWTIVFLVFAAVDSLALALLDSESARAVLAGLIGAGAGVAIWGKRIALVFGGTVGGRRLRVSGSLLVGVAAAVLVGALLVASGMLAADLWWSWKHDLGKGMTEAERAALHRELVTFPRDLLPLGAVVTAFVLGRAWPFVNRSSQHAFYSERLTRAYLGASNPARSGGTGGVTNLVPEDDLPMADYWGPTAGSGGAPLHLVNVTINETFGGRSNVEMKDLKGVGMALGPAGASVGVRHHAVGAWTGAGTKAGGEMLVLGGSSAHSVFGDKRDLAKGYSLPRMEALTLGQWVGISGAAFSTGLGSRTSLGLSILCGLANVRLGYWWEPGVRRHGSGLGLFPVQWHLVNELAARFPGTKNNHWYLSDGGHFENMGAYELVRRRMRRIVVVDAEADPEYTFEGLSNLVRKARLDFGAEIQFLTSAELDAFVAPTHRGSFGELGDLARGGKPGAPAPDAVVQKPSRARAAIARVRYLDRMPPSWPKLAWPTDGILLYVKTAILGDEPVDVLRYQSAHAAFPHESTADQFFDEPQWESYRKLGEHTALSLFGRGDPGWAAKHGSKERPLAGAWVPEWLTDLGRAAFEGLT
jgi:hypothetical protein